MHDINITVTLADMMDKFCKQYEKLHFKSMHKQYHMYS